MTDIIRMGLDTSKSLFQLHGVNAAEQPVLRKQLRRSEMMKFFEKLPPVLVVLEACGAAHHWARLLSSFGHEVKLIAPQLATGFDPSGMLRTSTDKRCSARIIAAPIKTH